MPWGTVKRFFKKKEEESHPKQEEMEKFLEKHNLPRLNQEETENINRPITSTEIEKL